MYFTQNQQTNEQKRTIDISSLQDFKINTHEDWTHWELNEEQFEGIPLGFINKYNFHKSVKFCDLSTIQQSQEDADYVVVQENIKKKNKDFISKNMRMNDNRQASNTFKRIYSKKWQRNPRTWTNQIKTNFKKISVKNNWVEIKTITKNALEGAEVKSVKDVKVQNIKTFGKLHQINPVVDRINWEETRFKENSEYKVKPIKTAEDKFLTQIAGELVQAEENSQEQQKRVSIICHPTFLFALLTVRAAVYPWNIEIQKVGNLIVLENFKNNEDQKESLTYLDLFTVNENTSNNMPTQQAKIVDTCTTATKMTKVFHDLLASGEPLEKQQIIQLFDEKEQQQEEQQRKQKEEEGQEEDAQDEGDDQQQNTEEELDKIRKYLKISFDKYDIYTYVEVDGAKKNNTTGKLEYYLIRTFLESQTQGVWIKSMKTPGIITTKEYQSNSCSIQKWICEAKLAGVEQIKTGYIGYSHNKSMALLNVGQISVKALENTLSFKYQNSWTDLRQILNSFSGLGDGTYVLAKNPYSPLSIKLYQTSTTEQQQEYEQEQEEGENGENQQSQKK